VEGAGGEKMKHIAYILFLVLPSLSIGQEDNSKKKYEYEICIYRKESKRSQILENKLIGIADTTTAFVSGTILDYKKEPIGFSVIYFESALDNSKYGALCDSLGKYSVKIPSGKYLLKSKSVGYSDLVVNDFSISTGEIRELDILLGDAGSYVTHSIISNKPLNKRKLNRIKRRIKKEK
jgi:hypothetical protein